MSSINFYKNLKIILSTLKTILEEDRRIKFMRAASRIANSKEKENSVHNFLMV